MKKDAYYFPHFCNARHDRKIKRVTKELGVEGYGIFFMLLEVLRDQTDMKYPMEDIDLLADEFGTSEQKVRAVICNYHLFDLEEEDFFSPKLLVYMQPYLKMKEQRRIAGVASGEARAKARLLLQEGTSVDQPLNGDEQSKVKESKVKENKTLPEHHTLASKLRDIVLLRRKRNITTKTLTTWANSFRLLMERDGREIQEIEKVLAWYEESWQDTYTPVIESADSLRKKFDKVLNAMERNNISTGGDSEWM